MAQPGEEIVTLRYFKIKKGSFDEFLRVSVEGVWPYFEKLGSRVIGMWKVITPSGVDGAPSAENKDFDEVYASRIGIASAVSGWYAAMVDFLGRLHTLSMADSS